MGQIGHFASQKWKLPVKMTSMMGPRFGSGPQPVYHGPYAPGPHGDHRSRPKSQKNCVFSIALLIGWEFF